MFFHLMFYLGFGVLFCRNALLKKLHALHSSFFNLLLLKNQYTLFGDYFSLSLYNTINLSFHLTFSKNFHKNRKNRRLSIFEN